MTSITQQKADLRAALHRRVEYHLVRHPDQATDVAMAAVHLLSARMTRDELADWYLQPARLLAKPKGE